MADPVSLPVDERAAPASAEMVGAAAPRTRPVGNASYLAAANLGSKALSFVLVIFATRILGQGLFGNYNDVIAFVGLFGVMTDLGMGTLAVRDVTQQPGLALRYISNLLVVRTITAVAAVAIIVALAQVMVAPSLRGAAYVYALALLPLAATNTLSLVFQFRERMAFSAVLTVATAALTSGLSLAALFTGHHVLALTIVFSAVATANALATAWIVYTRFLPRRLEVDLRWWPELVRRSLPFVTLTLLNVLYYRADTQILYVASGCGHAAAKAGCTPVGLYGLANRLPDILVMIFVGSIGAATLPAFNRVVAESRESLRRLARSSIALMLAFAVPVAIFGSVFAPEALHVLGGRQFIEAAPALAVLVWTFPFFLVENVLFNTLYALHRQRIVMLAFGITLVFNVVANILLVPHFSYMACSALTVASEALNLVVVFVALRGSIGSLQLGGAVARVGLIGAATAVVSALLHPLTIFVALPAGVLAALVGLRLSSALGPTERDVLGRLPLLGRFARWV